MAKERDKSNLISSIKPSKIILPVFIGLAVVGYMFYKEFDPEAIHQLKFTWSSALFLFVALLFMVGRDIGYIIRIRLLTDNQLSWKKSFKVIMLWEFTSAITPSAVGGTSVAILYISKEGISVGKSSAVVLATSFLDELYFIIMFPLLLLFLDVHALFATAQGGGELTFANDLFYFAVVGYVLKLAYTLFVSYGLFIRPRGLKWLVLWIFRLPFLRRYRHQAGEAGNEIVISSNELKKKSILFWLKVIGATFLSWTSRYWVVNALFLSFFFVSDHFLLFAKQLIMWIMMLISPTPGGSGFAEYIFSKYLKEFIDVPEASAASVIIALALMWRFISYYPYLIAGAIFLPGWLKKSFSKK